MIIPLLLLLTNLAGQVRYDTIPPDEEIFGGMYFDEMMVFNKMEDLTFRIRSEVNFPENYPDSGRVIVCFVFTRDGTIKETGICRSSGNPVFDSIAYYEVNKLQGWIPGMSRGRFIDIPFTVPVNFKNNRITNPERLSFLISEEDYEQRKQAFDFLCSDDPDSPMTLDYTTFSYYLAEHIMKERYSSPQEYHWPGIRHAILQKTNLDLLNVKLILIETDSSEWYSIRCPYLFYLKKDHNYIAIAYRKNGDSAPQLAIKNLSAKKGQHIEFVFKEYTREEFVRKMGEIGN